MPQVARTLRWVLRAPSVGIKLDGMPLYLSQRVEGRQGRKKPWVEGTIVAADAAAQLYEVQYSDGTRESGVERWLLRPHTGTYGSDCLYVYRTDVNGAKHDVSFHEDANTGDTVVRVAEASRDDHSDAAKLVLSDSELLAAIPEKKMDELQNEPDQFYPNLFQYLAQRVRTSTVTGQAFLD